MSPVPTSSVFCFISFSCIFRGLSISCVEASTRTFIIFWVTVKINQEINITLILKDENLQPISQAAMLGCRDPMVPTSGLPQWLCLIVFVSWQEIPAALNIHCSRLSRGRTFVKHYRTAWGNISDGNGLILEGIDHFCTSTTKEWRHNNVLKYHIWWKQFVIKIIRRLSSRLIINV